ncbi:uncharacterized protein LAESUDRAFT_761172 [Laetiporus sulphureus 93-53]|uniref:Uncharacterized protein n=1 Tax=Laetiporus sulphureus 93-53 TaxID=1314785 RepID=A0A165D8B2_9APHY|nr:uncharacterized protein LAESUDRAFT_761172 [Laetiporus sulphureus 93-53]KZT04317.1 hypothetical protein LAESUDRAFT_761172 [Laetiporus sulphureus 93-53]
MPTASGAGSTTSLVPIQREHVFENEWTSPLHPQLFDGRWRTMSLGSEEVSAALLRQSLEIDTLEGLPVIRRQSHGLAMTMSNHGEEAGPRADSSASSLRNDLENNVAIHNNSADVAKSVAYEWHENPSCAQEDRQRCLSYAYRRKK